MGLRTMRQDAIELKEAKSELAEAKSDRDDNPKEVWEYKAYNLIKSFGPTLESDFNKLGAMGWKFQTLVQDKGIEGYAIFMRRI